MPSTRFAAALLAALSCLVGLAACGGPPALVPQSPLDTAQLHYEKGWAALDEGDLRTASFEFERARALDEDHPGVYVGEALMASAWGRHFEARQAIERALHRDADFVDAHIALGRIVAAEGRAKGLAADDWLGAARRSFDRAGKLAPEDPRPDFERAEIEAVAGDLDAALESYGRVVARNRGPLVARALAASERLQTVLRTAPGTRLGARIALRDSLTRAELSVLLLEELRLETLLGQRRQGAGAEPPVAATPLADDAAVQASWATPWIERILALGIAGLEPMPDGGFHPERTVARADFARVLQGIIVVLSGDAGLTTRYVGETSRFPDLASDHFAYNAVALSVDRGLLQPDAVSGRFRPQAPITGARALEALRALQEATRMEYGNP